MADKYIFDITPYPGVPKTDTPNDASKDAGSTDSNSPYSFGNFKFAPYSINTMKN